jgi:hypothetical protein
LILHLGNFVQVLALRKGEQFYLLVGISELPMNGKNTE